MRQVLVPLSILGTLFAASAPVGAQIFAPGPYYATPSWDQKLPAATRFIVLTDWNSAAVLDRNTGLVWQRTPVGPPDPLTSNWVDAFYVCHKQPTGDLRGWRLPNYDELTSLLDPTQSNPALPAGNPFQGIGAADVFWTATTDEGNADLAWVVEIASGATDKSVFKSDSHRAWCVRGGLAATNPPY